MIQINNLNKNKTYIGLEVGTSFIAKAIQRCSQKDTNLPLNEIATHVFALVYIEGCWKVYEAHYKHKGCKCTPYEKWIEDQAPDRLHIYPYDFNIDALQYYCDFNPGYSFADISTFAIESLTDKDFFNNNPGFSCSEYLANCTKNFDICYKFKLPSYRIKPADWQIF